ncbi:MAG: ATP-binding cassette domain-containing protein [Alphaproteobacteria bacterium]
MATPIFTLKDTSIAFGDKKLFEKISLNISLGDRISLVGRNGSGKSTLLKIITGILEPDEGETFIQPGTIISYLPQEPDVANYKTLEDIVKKDLKEEEKFQADIFIEKLGVLKNQDPKVASGGEVKKAFLAKALINSPDILLLDEPTNHLDMPTIEILEELINSYKGAIILISHDRAFLNNTTNNMLWLDRGTLRQKNSGFKHFEAWEEQIFEQEIIEQKNFAKKLKQEEGWMQTGVTARRKRNQGRLRRLLELRAQRKEQIKQIGSIDLNLEEASFASKMVIEAKNISKTFGDRTIVKNFSTRIIKGNKIGVVGPNGAGKTTLIKLLTKKLTSDTGNVRMGKNLNEAYFDQNRITLDPKKTLWKTLAHEGDHIYVHGKHRHVVAYLKDFLFKAEQAQTPVSSLSGGEKNRLMLALVLAQPSNFLILDEPTNDLDMDTLDLLQNVLSDYQGTVLIISHDRDFLDNTVSSVIYMKGNGEILENAGSCTEAIEKFGDVKKAISKKNKSVGDDAISVPQLQSQTKQKTKLSYKDQRLLEIIPQEIAAAEAKIKEIETELMNPNLYTQDAQKFDELSQKLQSLKEEVDEKELKWLEISEM